MSTFSNGTEGVKVCVWPDGVWCEADEVHEFTHKSDDYATIIVSDEDPDGIDAAVELYLKGQ